MRGRVAVSVLLAMVAAVALSGCGGSSPHRDETLAPSSSGRTTSGASSSAASPAAVSSVESSSRTIAARTTAARATKAATTKATSTPTTRPAGVNAASTRHSTSAAPAPSGPAPGNPGGGASVPADAQPVDTSHPTHVIGTGTPATCTSAAVVAAVAAGGIITFNCGPAPVTITLTATAKVRNASPQIVLDGGGKVTLSGGGARRVLYMDTCDQAQGWTTSHCQDQSTPRLSLQNLTFADGNSTGQTTDGGGGGAVFVRGGRVKVINSKFVRNRCDPSGPDVGGAALRVLSQSGGLPVYVVGSTFGGAPGQGGICSNGGALSSIGVSWVLINSTFSNNQAIGHGANPAQAGTPGGGSGGAIYTDGNNYTVTVEGSVIADNHANAGGGAVFFVSNDRTGTMGLLHSQLHHNPNDGFQTAGLPGIFFLGARPPTVTATTISA